MLKIYSVIFILSVLFCFTGCKSTRILYNPESGRTACGLEGQVRNSVSELETTAGDIEKQAENLNGTVSELESAVTDIESTAGRAESLNGEFTELLRQLQRQRLQDNKSADDTDRETEPED